ncbi:tyrosine phosphatase [Coccidioides immitis RMSCC 2394]|uniref:Very-long-chain (3R)-3-hydroxyacyl-CoA dehydratase n=1 Tax=Coccidioides immitis RMSCC 2394 TaxID=404692 RepID=A0A0J6YNB3_COCIT|nr:tyrosine phosphatase [Coccidioides immitis RMSCC 2394]
MSAKAPASSVPAKTVFTTSRAYLLLYNTASFALWSVITLRLFLLLALLVPTGHVAATYNALFPLLRVTQSLALLEIVHSLVGIVRAPVITTLMQVASRIVVVWGVMWMFAEERVGREMGILGGGRRGGGKLGDWGFVGCLGAWGVTECV